MIPLLLALTLTAAEPQATAAAAPPAKVETAKERARREKTAELNKVVCRDMTPTGSSLPQNVCQTQLQWDKIREEAMRDARMLSDVSRDMNRNGR